MKYSLVLIMFFISSCASFSENFVKEGTHSLRGGRYEDQRWSDRLILERKSWFQELTLLFDVMYTSIEEGSPFEQWFSERELEKVNQCYKSKLILAYSLDSHRISKNDFYSQLNSQGWERVSVPHFSSFIKNHPDLQRSSLGLYDILMFCIPDSSPGEVKFPAFRNVLIE